MARAFITGANGFVGRHLIPQLVAGNWSVVGAVRRPEAGAGIHPDAQTVVTGDLAENPHLVEHLRGVDVVVHLAARVHAMADGPGDSIAQYRMANVVATEKLAEASARAGVRRFVFLSSVKAMGEGLPDRPYRDGDECRPEGGYSISKLEAEEALWRIGQRTGMETVSLRPPMVYGPGVRANFLRLIRLVDSGLPLPFGCLTGGKRSMIYAGNLVSLMEAAMTHPEARNQTFLVSDDEGASTAELVRRLARPLGKPSRLLPVPLPLLRLAGTLLRRQAEIQRLANNLTVDSGRVKALLGWSPPWSLDQGIEQTVRWYRQQGR